MRDSMDSFHLNEIYWTFQGEGLHTGRRALFVRLPFCSLDCSWCDTSFKTYDTYSYEAVKNLASQEKARFCVLTGGEPSLHKHTPRIIKLLKSLNFQIAMESNACHEVPLGVDYLTLSPKRDSSQLKSSEGEAYYIHPEAYKKASEFKYVVDKGFDFQILLRHKIDDGRHYYLSPEYSDMKSNLLQIMEFIQDHPGWKISLQTHKWIGIK